MAIIWDCTQEIEVRQFTPAVFGIYQNNYCVRIVQLRNGYVVTRFNQLKEE